jgi:hypothetical protein
MGEDLNRHTRESVSLVVVAMSILRVNTVRRQILAIFL